MASKVRPDVLARQAREMSMIPHVYEEIPVGTETPFATDRLAKKHGLSHSQMADVAQSWEAAGILKRRFEFIQGSRGRTYWWLLPYSKEEAMEKFAAFQIARGNSSIRYQRDTQNRSLKAALLAVITERNFSTTQELLKAVRGLGHAGTDLHHLKNNLFSLQREGKVTFKTSGTKDRVPYDIRLTKTGIRDAAPVSEPMVHRIEEIVEDPNNVEGKYDMTNFRRLPSQTNGGPVERVMPEPITVAPKTDEEAYPLATRLIARKDRIRAAAELAEAAGEEDIALDLLSKLDKPLSPIEAEAVALYEALVACRNQT